MVRPLNFLVFFGILTILSILIIPQTPSVLGYEKYYYLTDYPDWNKLRNDPVNVCDFETFNPNMPDVGKTLVKITEEAIMDWETKLQDFTENYDAWNFNYIVISPEDRERYSAVNCDIVINYQYDQQENLLKMFELDKFSFVGLASSYLNDQKEISVYYRNLNYSDNENTLKFVNEIDEDYILETVKHEIGHAIGLDHYPATDEDYTLMPDGRWLGPSIMDAENINEVSFEETYYEITWYDLHAVVNLYGKNGFQDTDFKSDEYVESFYDLEKIKPASFVSPNENPMTYIQKYSDDLAFKEWFDAKYYDITIEEAVGLSPLFPEPWNRKGVEYFNSGSYEQAIPYFQKALFIDPTFDLAKSNLNLSKERLESDEKEFLVFADSGNSQQSDMDVFSIDLVQSMESFFDSIFE